MSSHHQPKYGPLLASALCTLWASLPLSAAEPSDVPKPVPKTRAEIKAVIEALQQRQPRIPLPDPNEVGEGARLLPASWGGGGIGGPGQSSSRGARDRRGNAPDPRLDSLFTDPCFWVVSRANNCHYCLGHQELKLRAGGLDDATIAALDSNWNLFDPRQQSALAFARKLTLEPMLVGDADIAKLKDNLSDVEIIELAFMVAQFNSVNRWTDGMGLPQERSISEAVGSALETPAREQSQRIASLVTPDTRTPRGPLPDADAFHAAVAACRTRTPRVELPTAANAKAALAGAIGDRDPLMWEQALSALSGVGPTHVVVWNEIMSDDHLSQRLKSELAYITAVNNRAWYAVGLAAQRLLDLGVTPEQMALILEADSKQAPGVAVVHRLAAKLTVDPHLITDRDIAALRKHYSDPATAQIIHVICLANLFDRFTEALGLRLE